MPQMLQSSRGLIGLIGLDSDMVESKGRLFVAHLDITYVVRLCKGKDKFQLLVL